MVVQVMIFGRTTEVGCVAVCSVVTGKVTTVEHVIQCCDEEFIFNDSMMMIVRIYMIYTYVGSHSVFVSSVFAWSWQMATDVILTECK